MWLKAIAVALMAVALVLVMAPTTCMAQADEQKLLTIDFDGESLSQILQLFKRGYDLEYVLGEGVDPELSIRTHLRDVTLADALKIITEANGLVAVNQNGRWMINKRAVPTERETTGAAPLPALGGVRTPPPSPTRPTTTTTGAAPAAAADGEEDEEPEQILDIIWPRYLGAEGAAMIFGGSIIPNMSSMGGGGGYGGGYGSSGYGSSSYGSGGYGSSSYGSRGGSSSYGSSSYGSRGGSSSYGSRNTSSYNRY